MYMYDVFYLIVGGVCLKERLNDKFDYVLLPEDGWLYMVQHYGTLHGCKVSLHSSINQTLYLEVGTENPMA